MFSPCVACNISQGIARGDIPRTAPPLPFATGRVGRPDAPAPPDTPRKRDSEWIEQGTGLSAGTAELGEFRAVVMYLPLSPQAFPLLSLKR